MTPLVWASLALTVLFFGAWYGIPMWMTFKRPERHPDFAEARSYLRARAALGKGESVMIRLRRREVAGWWKAAWPDRRAGCHYSR